MTTKTLGTMAIGFTVLALLGAPAGAKGQTEREKSVMASTGADDDAEGRAKLKVRDGSDGRFEVQARRLDRNATYEVLVDGVHVAQLTTNAGGAGKVKFRSRPRSSRDQLLGFDPRGAVVSVRDAAGDDVLAVRLDDRSSDDGDVVCCIPDDSGPECEDRTPDECAAEGGTVSTATSCLPDPCDGVAPPAGADVVCCLPDDSGPECEDRTPGECAAEGGVVVEAASCDPNPCGAVTPPSGGDVVCCLPDDSGPECEDRTAAECVADGGVNLGDGVCAIDSCASIPPPTGGTVRVTCERRSGRSKVSVDGNDLASGSYRARVTSGGVSVEAPARSTVGDEVEFDFDSDGGDVAEGATPIAAGFIQGTPPAVTGAILTLSGDLVVEASVECLDR